MLSVVIPEKNSVVQQPQQQPEPPKDTEHNDMYAQFLKFKLHDGTKTVE